MAPLAEFLRIKTSVDVEPNGAEDKALMLVDQVRVVDADAIKRSCTLSGGVMEGVIDYIDKCTSPGACTSRSTRIPRSHSYHEPRCTQ